jgi:hypothetical protein
MSDDVRWISLAEALNYIATESVQASVWAARPLLLLIVYRLLALKSGKLGDSEKSGSDTGAGPVRSKLPTTPDEIQKLNSEGFVFLHAAAVDALKEEGRRGLKCRGTHPRTKEREDIKAGDWPQLIIPVEAVFDAKSEVLTEVKGVPIRAYENVTVEGVDLERRFPRLEKMKPAPAAPLPAPPQKNVIVDGRQLKRLVRWPRFKRLVEKMARLFVPAMDKAVPVATEEPSDRPFPAAELNSSEPPEILVERRQRPPVAFRTVPRQIVKAPEPATRPEPEQLQAQTPVANTALPVALPAEGGETVHPPPASDEADAAPAPGAEVKSEVPGRPPDQPTAGIQASAPPQSGVEVRTEPDKSDPAPKKGRRQYDFWPEVENYIFDLLVEHGPPSPDDPQLPNQKALEEFVAGFMQLKGWDAAESTTREHVVGMLEHWGKLGR